MKTKVTWIVGFTVAALEMAIFALIGYVFFWPVPVEATLSDDHSVAIEIDYICGAQATVTITPDYGSVIYMKHLHIWSGSSTIFESDAYAGVQVFIFTSDTTVRAMVSHMDHWDSVELTKSVTIPSCNGGGGGGGGNGGGGSPPNGPADGPRSGGGPPCLLDGTCPCFGYPGLMKYPTQACLDSKATSTPEPEPEPFVPHVVEPETLPSNAKM